MLLFDYTTLKASLMGFAMLHSFAVSEFLDQNKILDDLNHFGFAIIDHLYSNQNFAEIEQECLNNLQKFREAAIQNGVMSQIRSDHILWLDDTFPVAQQHISTLHHFMTALNQNFFLSLKEVEAHFACYQAGGFYALHRDNPQQKNHRVISSVFYLHQKWQADWGGQLRLQDKHGNWHVIQPTPNRLAIFHSDLLHEVLPAKQQRLSITAWLRTQQSIW